MKRRHFFAAVAALMSPAVQATDWRAIRPGPARRVRVNGRVIWSSQKRQIDGTVTGPTFRYRLGEVVAL